VSPEVNETAAIIGGGLAGLTCAHALKKRGIDSIVYEASTVAGGRSEAGVPYFLGRDLFRNTFRLIDETGLTNAIIPIAPYAGQVYKGKVYRHRVASATGLLRFKGLSIADKALLPRMAWLAARFGPQLDFHRPEHGIGLDDETVAAFVKRELSQNILNYVAGPLISTLFFYGSDETSRLLYLLLAKYMYNTQMTTIRGGIRNLVDRLARQTRVVHHPVRGLTADGDVYTIDGNRFSRVIVAVEGDAVLKIAGLEDLLSDEDRRFFSGCEYQPILSVAVKTERPLDGSCYAVAVPRVENMAAMTVSFIDYIDPSRCRGNEGLAVVSGSGPTVTAKALLEDLSRLYQVRVTSCTPSESKSAKFPPGRYRQIAAFKSRRRRPGLYFCGDYLMGPFIEGAITTGMRAAEPHA
jgi:oxygen-dependent protoporphyrinogen oxidase